MAGCGRIGFDPPAEVLAPDAAAPLGVPLISVDPGSLPPFGNIRLVTELSSAADDDDPCLRRDQLEVFFDSFRGGNDDLWVSHRASVVDAWSVPVPLAEINSLASEEHPSIARDGLTLYFTSDRGGDANVWFSKRVDVSSPFGAPSQVADVNTMAEDRMGSIDALDQSLFLSSTRDSPGADQLYEARRSTAGEAWSPPALVAEIVASAGDPSVHVDDRGVAMYLVQNNNATKDLFWTTRPMAGAPWAATVPVAELNTGVSESDPWLSPALRVIYFVRDDGVGTKDIYMATR